MGCCNINFFGAMPQANPAVYSQGTSANFFANTPVFTDAQTFCARPYASPLWEMDRQYGNAMIAASQSWINQNAMSSYLQPTAYTMPMTYATPMTYAAPMAYSTAPAYGGYASGYGQATPYDNIMQSYNQTCQQLAYFQGQLDMLRSQQATGTGNKKSTCGCGCKSSDSSDSANSAAKLTIPDAQKMLIMNGTGNYTANDNDNIIVDGGNCAGSSISAKGGDDYIESNSNNVEINPGEGNNVVVLSGQGQTVDATEGRNLIYINKNNANIITDGDDILAFAEDVDLSTISLEGSSATDDQIKANSCMIKELTDAQKNPFRSVLDEVGEPLSNPANHLADEGGKTAENLLGNPAEITDGDAAAPANNDQAADQTADATAAAADNNQAADQTGDANAVTTEDRDNAIANLESSSPDYEKAKEVFGKLAADETAKNELFSIIDLIKSANDTLSSSSATAENCNAKIAELTNIINALNTATLNNDTLPYHILPGLKTKLEEKASTLSEATAAPETESEAAPGSEQSVSERLGENPTPEEVDRMAAEIDGGGFSQSSEEAAAPEAAAAQRSTIGTAIGSTIGSAIDSTIGSAIGSRTC